MIIKTTKQSHNLCTVKVPRAFSIFVHLKNKKLHTCPFSSLIIFLLFPIFSLLLNVFSWKSLHSNKTSFVNERYFWNIWTVNVFTFRFVKRWLWENFLFTCHINYYIKINTFNIYFGKLYSQPDLNWWNEQRNSNNNYRKSTRGSDDEFNK